jgi:hypothetical protein
MTGMSTTSMAMVLIGAAVAFSQAQEGFRYPPPPVGSLQISRDIQYGATGDVRLLMDVYRPAGTPTAAPALIFFNTATGADRKNAFYAGWAQTAADKGLVGIVPDLRSGMQAEDFHALVRHLTARAADYGIDREALAVYAGSGNVFTAFPIVEGASETAIKAAVMYYGIADVGEFRRDLPVLYVRAGLDRPPVNRRIGELAALAITQNAPVTLLNHPSGHHAFEMVDGDAATRDVIERTLDFVKRATSSAYQSAMRQGLAEAEAAGSVLTGNYAQAASQYAHLVTLHPDDARLRLAYGEALLGNRQFETACREFDKLRDKGLGYRDLGLPAARACMQHGDADAAIAWLRSIPQRFLPADVRTDPVFAPLQGRPDFAALFQR